MPYLNPQNPPERMLDPGVRRYQDGQRVTQADQAPVTRGDPTDQLWAPKEKTPARGRGKVPAGSSF
jgi:hypothetical protein